jgi:hypothetical protein
MKRTLLLAFLGTAVACAGAEPMIFSSGTAKVALIELYTSEGCSSCPPADQWLGALKDESGLWTSFVPVEFHVNYWDSLGWKDRLSNPAFTAREYAYASAWGSPNVYTPCFVRNGAEWRRSWGSSPGDMGSAGGPPGALKVSVAADGTCNATFAPGSTLSPGNYQVYVALLGGGLSSKPNAGENEGSTLRHEFVVLGLTETTLAGSGPRLEGRLSLPSPSVTDAKRRAVAAWVTRQGDLAPLQATGGWLP